MTNALSMADLRGVLTPGQRLLGLDVGSKTVGLALSDMSLTIASPLQTIRRTKFRTDGAELAALIDTHGVGGLVYGWPINMDGSKGPRCQATMAFARNLAALVPLPFALWDERLSTAAVERTLIEADRSRARRAELVDKMAAAYILQGAMAAL